MESIQQKPRNIKILLVDDHPLVRQALRSVIEKHRDLEVVAEASDGQIAIELTNSLSPEVVIMDISMPQLNGLEATKQIKASHPETGILILTVHDEDELILSMFEAGADGYLIKSVFGDDVIHAIRAVASGETVISPVISRRILKYALQNRIKPILLDNGNKLTEREIEILRLVAKGVSNKDIADKIGLSLRTVKSHLVTIFAKLNVSSRTEAIVVSLRMNILSLDDLQ